MERIIGHADINCFFAAVEMLRNPRLRSVPLAVCGDPKLRQGVVTTANYIAKAYGVKAGLSIMGAKQLCPDLYIVPTHYDDYDVFSEYAREIMIEYTPRVESYGRDEFWFDLTGCVSDFNEAEKFIKKLMWRYKRELGLTLSIGLAESKIIAKIASDIKKPNAYTIVPNKKIKEIIWPLPIKNMFFVGSRGEAQFIALKQVLNNMKGEQKTKQLPLTCTIGDLANMDPLILQKVFKKLGPLLHTFANGKDQSEVAPYDWSDTKDSISCGHTCPRDLKNNDDVRIVLGNISDSLCTRLMAMNKSACTIYVYYVGSDLKVHGSKQLTLNEPIYFSCDIRETAMGLFKKKYDWRIPIRKIGIEVRNLVNTNSYIQQYNLFESDDAYTKKENIEKTLYEIRTKFGNQIIQSGFMLEDKQLALLNSEKEQKFSPVGAFKGGMSVAWGGYTTAQANIR